MIFLLVYVLCALVTGIVARRLDYSQDDDFKSSDFWSIVGLSSIFPLIWLMMTVGLISYSVHYFNHKFDKETPMTVSKFLRKYVF